MDVVDGAIQSAADSVGVPAAGLKLVLSIILSAPLCYLFKEILDGKPPIIKHLCYALTGLALSYYNYGYDSAHFFITVFINFVLLRLIGGTVTSVVLSMVFNMGYLLTAYVFLATDGYDITWTTPQCIITLRMIGIAYDLMDGCTSKEKLSADQQKTCINKPPSLLELMSATFFPGGFFVGPQFSFKMYLDFISERGVYEAIKGKECPDRLSPAIKGTLLGLACILIYSFATPICGPDAIYSDEFMNGSAFTKYLLYCGFGTLLYFKYVGFWLITEGICICAGLGYSGKDENGEHKWDAVVGVHLFKLLATNTFRGHIYTFNLTTNLWTSRYIYKRCKFLGNRHLSQGISLFFLASWHGLYIGYYLCFMLEMLYIMAEDQMRTFFNNVPFIKKLSNSPAAQIPIYILTKGVMQFYWAYAITPFILLRVDRIHHVWSQFYYSGHIIYGSLLVLFMFVLNPQMKMRAKKEEKDKLKKSD